MTNDYLSACPIGQTKCMSKLTVDWYVGGDQLLTFERGCMADNDLQTEPLSCTEGRSDFVYYKDCTLMCDGNDCNTDKEVELGYTGYDEAGNQKEVTCYEYSSKFDYQGPEDAQDIDRGYISIRRRFRSIDYLGQSTISGNLKLRSIDNFGHLTILVNRQFRSIDDFYQLTISAYRRFRSIDGFGQSTILVH